MGLGATMRVSIVALALDLALDENKSGLVCPWCLSSDKSFSVKRLSTGVLYNCYRSTCQQENSSAGFMGVGGAAYRETRANKPVPKVGRPFQGDMHPLANPRLIEITFGITEDSLNRAEIMFSQEFQRYILPVRGRLGELRGHVARRAHPDQTPKSLSFPLEPGKPFAAWYGIASGSVVLVEDQYSAIRVEQETGHRAVALMGTEMHRAVAMEIAEAKARTVIICLDKDATKKAFQMRQEWGIHWGCEVLVIPLDKDFKDDTSENIKDILRSR